MGKSNLLTLFITVIAVVVAAELLVNDYTSPEEVQKKIEASGELKEAQSSVLGADADLTGETSLLNFGNDSLAPKATADLNGAPPAGGNAITEESAATSGAQNSFTGPILPSESDGEALISFALIERVGFRNIVLQRIPFNGIMFELVDMRDFRSVPVIRHNLLQNNREQVAEFYEMHAESQLLANEIFLLIREKALSSIEAGINETNEFGDGSYYINYSNRPETAFLVVKIRESVYSFVYKKELHSFIKSLIPLL